MDVVLKVRDEIEQLLDDDGDMAEMYLTEKMLRQQQEDSQLSSAASSQRSSSLQGDGAMGETSTITTISRYPEVTLEDTLKHRQETMHSQDQAPPELELEIQAVGIGITSSRQQKVRSRDHLSPPRSSFFLQSSIW